ncbi:MAG TPA: MFS transporter [Solirubrobacteraceae bacterium]|nr:MFS transporter [Solirubrobacteraceae bacterium]
MTSTSRLSASGVDRLRAGSAVALALICGAQFVLQLDFSIVTVALPSIERDLRLSSSALQWLVTGYALTFGSLLLVGGRAADLLGRRRVLSMGLAGFALASLLAGLAQSAAMLIAARIIQGSAGALVAPAALSLLTATYPEGPERNRALGIWQAATAAGATVGIVVGGLLTQYLGWRAIFLINPPLIAVMLTMVPRFLPAVRPDKASGLDVAGATLSVLSLAGLILGLSNGESHGFAAAITWGPILLGLLLAIVFVVVQRRGRDPMLPLSLFASPTRRAALEAMVLTGAVLAGYVYFTSLYLQHVRGFTPLLTGLALLPSTLTVVCTSTLLARRLLARVPVKSVLILGLVCIAAGQAYLSQITPTASYGAAIAPGLILTALGIGLALPSASVAITAGVSSSEQGLAGGLFVTGQQTGAALGLASLVAISVAETSHDHSLTAGYRLAFLVGSGLAIAAAAAVAAQLSRRTSQGELHRQAASAGGQPPHPIAQSTLRHN